MQIRDCLVDLQRIDDDQCQKNKHLSDSVEMEDSNENSLCANQKLTIIKPSKFRKDNSADTDKTPTTSLEGKQPATKKGATYSYKEEKMHQSRTALLYEKLEKKCIVKLQRIDNDDQRYNFPRNNVADIESQTTIREGEQSSMKQNDEEISTSKSGAGRLHEKFGKKCFVQMQKIGNGECQKMKQPPDPTGSCRNFCRNQTRKTIGYRRRKDNRHTDESEIIIISDDSSDDEQSVNNSETTARDEEENSITENNWQDRCENPQENIRYPRRSNTSKTYFKKPKALPDDMYLYCDVCDKEYVDMCPNHKVIHVKDIEIPKNPNDSSRALKTCPEGLEVKASSIPKAGNGVWASVPIKKGTIFGPYDGVYRKGNDKRSNHYMWEIRNGRKLVCIVDALDTSQSNWMRFVNCALTRRDQNLAPFQYKGKIYYRASEDIPVGQELFVDYGQSFTEYLAYQKFQGTEDLSELFSTFDFPLRFTMPDFVRSPAPKCKRKEEKKRSSKVLIEKLGNVQNHQRSHTDCASTNTVTPAPSRTGNSSLFRVCVVCRSKRTSLGKVIQSGIDTCQNCVFDIKIPLKRVCDKKYCNTSNLQMHLKEHSSERLYTCAHCNETYQQFIDLREHIRVHTCDKYCSCQFCSLYVPKS